MRTIIPIVLVLLVALSGCKPRPRPPTTTKAEDPVVSMVQGVNRAVKRHVTLVEMHDLHLFIETAYGASGKMPTKEFIFDAMKKENPKLFQMLQDGTIILTELQTHEGVWAYDKDARTQGGIVLTHNGASRMTLEEVKQQFAGQ